MVGTATDRKLIYLLCVIFDTLCGYVKIHLRLVDSTILVLHQDKTSCLYYQVRDKEYLTALKGEKVARLNNDSDWWQNFNQTKSSIDGFDILESVEVLTSGLYGGDNLIKTTTDGWTLTISEPQPDGKPFEKYLVQRIFLISPDKKEEIFITKDGACELRAFGFSDTGNSFVVALSCDLTIYSRM